MTEAEKENWIDYPELRKKWIELIKNKLSNISGTFTEWRDITMVSLFILIPPTRIGNYETMRIRFLKTMEAKSLKQDRNYLMINEKTGTPKYTLCFNKYKTARFIGQTCEEITDETMIKVLDKYITLRLHLQPINKYKFNDTDTLFINTEKKQLSQSYITETLKKTTKKYIDKKLSCDLFRKIFLTNFLNDNSKSIEDRKKMAKTMGQQYAPSTAETYRKIVPPKPPQIPILLSFD